MDKGVFAKEAWTKYAAENVLLVTLDFPKDKTIVPEKYVTRNEKIGQLGAGKGKTPESFISEFKAVVRLSPANIEAFVKANPDKAKAYKAAIKGVEDAKTEFADWIGTKPERNEENTKKFQEFQKSIQTAQDELGKF